MSTPVRPRRPPVVPAAPRLAARARASRQQRRRRVLRRAGLALAVAVPLLALGWLLLVSPVLAVRTVRVTGTDRLTPAQVAAAVRVDAGTPLARVDTGAVTRRVDALAPVAQVTVRRGWPHTLRVTVVERTPAAAVARADGGYQLLDAGGVPFASADRLPPGTIRLLLSDPSAADPATRAVLAVLHDLPSGLRAQVRAIRAGSPSSVELLLPKGRRVLWGAPGDTTAKAEAAQALIRLGGTVFDVSSPGVVTRR